MEETYKKKSLVDQELAVKMYQDQQKEVNQRVYSALAKSWPKRSRQVVKEMMTKF